jgi:uncharacterized protein (TIGR03084 family)
MKNTCRELLDEYRELAALCDTLSDANWTLRTDFYGWTPWDEVAHLCYFDQTSLQAVTDPDAFLTGAQEMTRQVGAGKELSALAREAFVHLDGPALLAHWRLCCETLVAALESQDPKARLPWYGPSMSAKSFATARLMETWAHGQDVWDVMGQQRPASHRLRAIAHIGVNTFGWTFVNRKIPVLAAKPFVELSTPDGKTWTWGEPSESDWIRGSAQDFCLLVTQRRHRSDTELKWAGEAAEQWTLIAQCFAGAPVDGPAPGVRSPL